MKNKIDRRFGRAETGPMQFDGDWRGLFIRGDNAMHYALCLESVLNGTTNGLDKLQVQGLLRLLQESNEFVEYPVQKMKNYDDCIRGEEDEETD